MSTFPALSSDEAYRKWRANRMQWLPIAMDIARSHRLPSEDPHVFSTGTNLVVALDDKLILKIFPPTLLQQFVSERATLTQLQHRVDIAIPKIILEGERDGWPYLVLTRLAGILGSDAWPHVMSADREVILQQIGGTIAQVQQAPLGIVAKLEPAWTVFLLAQIENCRARHRRLGLPSRFWADLDDLIREALSLVPTDRPSVILTGEYIPENFLLAEQDGGWRLAGLFDFGDVFTGWGEYDLLGPSAFMAAGNPRLVASLMKGYGHAPSDLTPTLIRRLLTLMFLHRASDPLRHVCIPGWQKRARDFRDLERMIWPT